MIILNWKFGSQFLILINFFDSTLKKYIIWACMLLAFNKTFYSERDSFKGIKIFAEQILKSDYNL